jgi:hypothetical protein
VSIPSTRGFGSRETACEPCAVSLKRFAGKSYYLGRKVGSRRKRCFMKRVPMPPSSGNQMGTTMRLYVVREHVPSILTTSTSGSRGLNICMIRLTRRLGLDRVLSPSARFAFHPLYQCRRDGPGEGRGNIALDRMRLVF